jgi:tetratricopeptide (TPR) repeat protein
MSSLHFASRAALCFAVLAIASSVSAPRASAQSATAHSGATSAHQQEIQEHLRNAAGYLQNNQPTLALPEFKAIVALDPKNVDALGNLGVIYFFANDYPNSIPNLRAALKLKPGLWKIQALLGIAEHRTGQLDPARADLERAFPNLTEKNVQIQTGMELIDLYSSQGELDKAATVVSKLREIEPEDEALLYTAYRLYSDLAQEAILDLTLVNPNSARLHQAIAHELAKRGDSAGAIENYRAALKADPNLPGLHFELAEMLSTVNTPDALAEAQREYQAALTVDPNDAQAEVRLGDIASKANDLDSAQQHYQSALKIQPSNADALVGLARVYSSKSQPDQAAPLLEKAVQADPTSSLAHFRLSTVYRQLGRTADAQHELEQYQKYKAMKEKLRGVYHDMHLDDNSDEKSAADTVSPPK